MQRRRNNLKSFYKQLRRKRSCLYIYIDRESLRIFFALERAGYVGLLLVGHWRDNLLYRIKSKYHNIQYKLLCVN